MRSTSNRKKMLRQRREGRDTVDIHKWASKMELNRLLSGKADLKIKREGNRDG